LTSCPGLTGASSTAQRRVFAHRIRISALEYWVARSKPGDNDETKSKSGPEARRFAEMFSDRAGVPGRSEAPPGLESHFLDFFFAFDFFAFFAFFAFLAIASSFGFNGRKRDTRHARRRASLATSSNAIPTDSRRAARTVTPLSSRYPQLLCVLAGFSPPVMRSAAENPRAPLVIAPARRLGTVNDAATCRRILHRSGTAAAFLHDFKTTGHGLLRGGESPLSDVAASCLEENGDRHGWDIR
jgi:hypothetical protein